MINPARWFFPLLLCLPLNCSAQEITANQLLKKVGELYSAMKSYSFDGMAIWEKQSEGSYERREFPFLKLGQEPGRNRYEAGWPRKRISACFDGQKAWIYVALNNQYASGNREDVLQIMRGLPGISELTTPKSYLNDYINLKNLAAGAQLLGEETLEIEGNKIPCYLVEYVDPNKSSKAGFMEVYPRKIWVQKTDFVILKDVTRLRFKPAPVEPFVEATETLLLKRFQVNQPIEESQFVLNPPANARSLIGANGSISSASDLLGTEAPKFALKSLEGKEFSLEKLRGSLVLLDFWASWCKPCRVEMPIIEKLYREYKDKGLVVLGINDENPELMKKFLSGNEVSFPLLVDDGEVMHSFGIRAIPTLVLIDREGQIAWHHMGASGERLLKQVLDEAGLK